MYLYTVLSIEIVFHFFTVKVATGDVNITDSAIGAVAGPGAQVGTASVISQLPPLNKNL